MSFVDAFADELDKIAISKGMVGRALAERYHRAGARLSTPKKSSAIAQKVLKDRPIYKKWMEKKGPGGMGVGAGRHGDPFYRKGSVQENLLKHLEKKEMR